MNKTVNINLAGVFFHIDEDAYAKLQRYLSAIKRSFAGVAGEDEIIADIEARISELFSERLQDERRVVGMTQLDEVIAIMGQPEDYIVDDDIFEDDNTAATNTRTRTHRPGSEKKLYRDVDNAYIGGVSSGLGHYLGIDSLWIRLGLVLIVIAGVGFPIFLYILLWVLIPEASSTADKLSMTGKAINIDNIQEKVKEGFENVSDAVKNVDYDKYGKKIKKGTQGFFGVVGNVIMFFLKVLAKILGVLFIIAGAAMVIGLFIGFISMGSFDIFSANGLENFDNIHYPSSVPLWLTLLLVFFVVGIPFFLLFYLGLKILATNIKSMPLAGKLTLLGLWLVSVIGLGVIGIKEMTEHSFSGKVTTEKRLDIKAGDTLRLTMRSNETFNLPLRRSSSTVSRVDATGEPTYVSRNVRLIVRETQDETGYIKIAKEANSNSFESAKKEAGAINYEYLVSQNGLALDGFFSSATRDQYQDQEVEVILYLPENSYLFADDNTYSYHRNSSSYRDILDNGYEGKYLLLQDNDFICNECPDKSRNKHKNTREDSWEYYSYQEGQKPDWEKDSASATQFIMLDSEVSLQIGSRTTLQELQKIKEALKSSDQNIIIDFSESEFTNNGRIKKLSLSVDCNDGFKGKTVNTMSSLRNNKIGFARDYSPEAGSPFSIGKL